MGTTVSSLAIAVAPAADRVLRTTEPAQRRYLYGFLYYTCISILNYYYYTLRRAAPAVMRSRCALGALDAA